MTQPELLAYLRRQKWAVACSVSERATPEAALVGIAVTPDLAIVFDTTDDSRKVANLRRNPAIAFVIGGWIDGDERTLQYEGRADFPAGAELQRLRECYFAVFPEGRKRAAEPHTVLVRATPSWLRYSDFNASPPHIQEFAFALPDVRGGD